MNLDKLPSVSAIIVNYRSAEHAINCIKSLIDQQGVNVEILVVDNCSGDDSVSRIREAYGDHIRLIENPSNDGFASANNLAAAFASGDYILAINPDIKLLQQTDVVSLVEYLAENSSIGVLGPNIIESRRNKRVLPKRHYPQQDQLRFTHFLKDLPGEYAWLLGACMLFRTEVYRRIGGFDNDFFLYGEDTDICLRLRQAGYSIGCLPSVQVDHWGGASEMESASYDKWRRKKHGYYQFCMKHYAPEDTKCILGKMLRKCRVKLGFLKMQSWFFRGSKGSNLDAVIERKKAEIDVLLNFLKHPELKRD